jgi:hypothetical protein
MVMVGGSVVVDIITILISTGQEDKFTFMFMPLLEVFIKLAIIGFTLYYEMGKKKSNE